ncbi:MAG TPA: MFS transporter [Chlorobaculum sp.]|nr:MFS transporter [Chlorobaculum sp.]
MQEKKIFGLGKNVFFAGLVSLFMDVSSEMIYPLVPLYLADVLGANKSLIGLIEGVAEFTASLLKVFSGWFSDRIGRRKSLMLAGYLISTLSRPVIALAGSWQQVFASRFVDRLGKGVRTAPRDAIIAETSDTDHLARSFSYHRSMDTMGAVVGPAIAFLWLRFHSGSYQVVFWLSMIPGLIAILIIVAFIREKKTGPPVPSANLRISLRHVDGRAKFFILIAALFALGNSSDAFLILRSEQLGISATAIPVVYLLFNLIYSISAIPAGMAADKYGSKRIILMGYVLFSALYYGFAVARSSQAIWVLFPLYGVFMGLTEGVQKAFLATLIPVEFKATAFGLFASAVGFATLPANLIGGLLWDRVSPAATFYFGAASAGLSSILFMVLIAYLKSSELNPPSR